MDSRIGEIALSQCGVVFKNLGDIDTRGNHCRDVRERDAGALEYGFPAEYAGVGYDLPAASVIGRKILRETTAQILNRHMECDIAARQNEIRSFDMPSARNFRSAEHEIAR
jgi:hypothetical protein